MQHRPRHNVRLLAIDPSPRGFGFAVLEGSSQLIDWGIAVLYSRSTEELLVRVETFVDKYRPACIVIESIAANQRRTCTLERLRVIAAYARSRRIMLRSVTRAEVRGALPTCGATRHDIASALVTLFPELAPRLPRRRTIWSSDDERMNIFDAVSFALTAVREAIGEPPCKS